MNAVVIGGGHHGLAAALVLGREGIATRVLEARSTFGGLCAGEEFHPGYSHIGIHHDSHLVRPAAVMGLQLLAQGLVMRDTPPWFLASSDPGSSLLFPKELERLQERKAHTAWRATIDAAAPFVGAMVDGRVPPVGAGESTWPVLQRALQLRSLGGDRMVDLLRVGALSVEDWLSEHFADPRLRSAIALPALLGSYMGPRSPHSAGLLLLHEAALGREVLGGPASLVRALVTAVGHQRVTLRPNTRVSAIRVERGVTTGVVLEDGEVVTADLVVSTLDPRATAKLLPPGAMAPDAEAQLRHVRVRSTVAKVHLALSALPESASRPDLSPERWRVVGSPRELEQAFDEQKQGRLPTRPALDVRVPTLSVPSLAPAGHHVLSVMVWGVPPQVAGGWTEATRRALVQSVLRELEVDRPGLRDAVVGSELLVAPDLEAKYGVSGGHLMHGEHALDQLFVGRPGKDFCRLGTPVPGLFVAGGGTHPHGGCSAVAGWLGGRAAAESA